LQLDVTREILARQARTPQKIKRCPGEMLKRLANDLAPRRDGQFIAKGNVQIAERDFAAMSIKDRHDKSESMREAEAGFAREQWD
jgi:hypothetical protein